METSGDKLENSSSFTDLTQPTSSQQNIRSILKENNSISKPIRFNQKGKFVPLQKVKKRLRIHRKPLVRKHQTLEYYEVADDGELVRDTAENQWLIDSIESRSESGENIHESIAIDNLAPFEKSDIATRQLKRKFIFNKCFSIVYKEGNKIQAKCMLCDENQNKFIRGDERSISNFVMHLKRIHITAFEEYSRICMRSCFPSNKQITQDDFDESLVRFVVSGSHEFSIVEEPDFIYLLNLASNGKFTVMSRQCLRKNIDQSYNIEKQKLIQTLSTIRYVSLTADIWSNRHKSYLGVTLHYIDHSFKRVSKLLSCARFKGVHSGLNIASELQAVVHEFELDNKVVAIVTDNGSNFVRALKDFGLDVDDWINFLPHVDNVETDEIAEIFALNEEFDTEISQSNINEADDLNFNNVEIDIEEPSLGIHLRCGSHTMNLVSSVDAKASLANKSYREMHLNAFQKLKSLFNKYNRPKTYEIIHNTLKSGLDIPNKTRWNSVYDSVANINKKESRDVNKTMEQLELPKFTPNEFIFLNEYVLVTKPIAEAIDNLQRGHCFFSIYLPTLITVKTALEKMKAAQSFLYCTPLLCAIYDGFMKRFGTFFDFQNKKTIPALLAAVSDPFFKLRWVSKEYATKENIVWIENLLINVAETEFKQSMTNNNNNVTPASDHHNKGYQYVFENETTTHSSHHVSDAKLQVLSYLKTSCSQNGVFSQLDEYDTVKAIFLKYNTPMPASAPSERVFSHAKFILRPQRQNLADEIFQKTIFLKLNYKTE